MDDNPETSQSPRSDPEQWVEKHADGLYRYALLRVGDPDIAEDLVQETFLAALTARKNFIGKSSERTWLIAILRNKNIEYWRKNKHSVSTPPSDPQQDFFDDQQHWAPAPIDWKSDPQQQLSSQEFWQIIQKCISKLGQTLSDAFLMSQLQKFSSETICKHLKISPEGLWSRLHRARLNLRHCLEKNWFTDQDKDTQS